MWIGKIEGNGKLYKPILLNFALFAWNSLFTYSIISIWVTGSKFVPR